ncbi:MAG: ABC transporter ATP-binding protein [Chloroflexi bacterium]|nr:ABC transporter ATP-binding protein [Chloroflexota bacterium]
MARSAWISPSQRLRARSSRRANSTGTWWAARTGWPGLGDPAPPAVELRGITKRFGTLVANDGIDLSVRRGEIHALLGENGAGKTTLMRVVYGLTRPDSGEIVVAGRPVAIRSPKDAIAAGIGMVTQHFSLVRPMTVAENLALGRGSGMRLDLTLAAAAATEASQRLGMRVQPSARVDSLSIGQQQRVEIVKALARDCRVLILDEPTAVLVPQEVEGLFSALRKLAAQGLAIVFISHKLGEVLALTDRVTVLRGGRVEGSAVTAAVDERTLAELMVGRPVVGQERAPAVVGSATRDPLLEVDSLAANKANGLPALRGVSFRVHAREVLGVAGVSGNGQSELVEVLSGTRPLGGGLVKVAGVTLRGGSVPEVIRAGIGRIAEDRQASVVGDLSVAYNLVLERIDDFRKGGRLDEEAIQRNARSLIERFAIRATPQAPVRTLSGGNIQKVLLARVLAREPKVLIVSQPTRGLDVGATEYVRSELLAARERGAAVLLVSEDLDELLALSDRLIVMYEGKVVGALNAAGADRGQLGLLMAGRGSAGAAAEQSA